MITETAKTAAPPYPAGASVTDLVTRARNGDQQAWDALVERYASLIWSICRGHRLGDAGTGRRGPGRRRPGRLAAAEAAHRSGPRSGRAGWLARPHDPPGMPAGPARRARPE